MKFLKQWWLPALILTLPLQRIPSFDVSVWAHTFTVRTGFVMALLGIVLFINQLIPRRISVLSPYFWLVLYIAVMFLSTITSIDHTKSAIVLIATVLAIGCGVIVSRIMTLADLPRVQTWLFIAAVLACLFGIYQFIGDSFGLPTWLTGLRPNYVKAVFGFPRIQATLLEPLFFANFLILPALLTAGLIYTRQLRGYRIYLQLLLMSVTMALTLSRGGIVGSILGVGIIAAMLIRKTTIKTAAITFTAIALGAGCAVGMIYASTSISSSSQKGDVAVKKYVKQSTNLTATNTSADSDRVVSRRLALQEFHAHPILGGGIGSFGSYAKSTIPAAYPKNGNSPTVNNEYYEVLAETGVAGAIALGGFVLTMLLRIIRSWRTNFTDYQRVWLVGLVATGIAYGVQYYAFSTLYITHVWVTIGILLAITAPMVQRGTRSGSRSA